VAAASIAQTNESAALKRTQQTQSSTDLKENNNSSSSLFEQGLRLVKMGTKFKQQIEEIEAAKKRRKQQPEQQQGNRNDGGNPLPSSSDRLHYTTPPAGGQVVGLAQLTPGARASSAGEEVKYTHLQ
jgi:hypothetical protein